MQRFALLVVGAMLGTTLALTSSAAASYSGSAWISPNPVLTWSSATEYCSWNAYYSSTVGYPDALCQLDGLSWYASSSSTGSASKVLAAGSLSIGVHHVTVKFAVGQTLCFGRYPCYTWGTSGTSFTVTDPNYFQFKVIDKNNSGLPNVDITITYPSNSCSGPYGCIQGVLTNSSGSATLPITYFTPGNTYNMDMQKEGYWSDVQTFSGTQNFFVGLPPNELVYVYSIDGFSNSICSQLSWTNGVSLNVEVGAYVAGSGFDLTYSATQSTTFTSPAPPNGRPLEERDGYYSTGNFHYIQSTKTYTIDNAWLYGPRATLDFGYFIPDYFTPSTASGGSCFFSPCAFGVGPGVTISNTLTVSGSLTVQVGLDVTVGVDVNVIVGVSVSVELKVYLAVTVGTSYSLTWTIYNTDTVSHTFEVYDETGSSTAIIPHIWTIS